jgi:hypothetical protein
MNQLARRPLPHMTAEEFLAWPGDGSGRRFQLVAGEIRPMSPASRIHGVIQIHRRDATGAWQADPELVGPGERLHAPSIGLDCSLDEAYANTWLTRAKSIRGPTFPA